MQDTLDTTLKITKLKKKFPKCQVTFKKFTDEDLWYPHFMPYKTDC